MHLKRIFVNLNMHNKWDKRIYNYLHKVSNKYHISSSQAFKYLILEYFAHSVRHMKTPITYGEYDNYLNTYYLLQAKLNDYQMTNQRNSYNLAKLTHYISHSNSSKNTKAIKQLVKNSNQNTKDIAQLSKDFKDYLKVVKKLNK